MMMGGGWFVGLIVLVLFLLLIGGGVAAIVWFAAQGSRGSAEASRQEPRRETEALEILRQRYARGEIDQDEFQQMRKEIES